ncbi:hypothetical protein [Mongoliitalea daihaiensis]|uniref:hypothetical protein n=1 Tax=Mongoliitalea daihaiensis TaxID=2782006 RepID=UPI001F28CEB4|nr:hypothetical protein [Mongoliitalea daihaiensis]UJP63441.1 hypothetical protein IPZ59_11330 [Mongoliitalea daihaiensis]
MLRFLGVILLVLLTGIASIAMPYASLRTATNDWKKSNKSSFLDGRVTASMLDSLDAIYAQKPSGYNFFLSGNDLQVFVGCAFDLYKVTEQGLDSKYKLYNRGYTCGSYPFQRDSITYLIGGNGFWSAHMDLLWFDEFHGSWEFIKTKNQPLNYFTNGIFTNSQGIYTLFGSYFNPRRELSEPEYQGYFLDWESKEWKRVLIAIDGFDNFALKNSSNIRYLETQDYLYFVLTNQDEPNLGWNIIEKETGKVYFYEALKNEDVFLSPFNEIIGNQIFYQSPNGRAVMLDLDRLKSQSKEVGKLTITDIQESRSFLTKDLAYSLVIVSLVLFIGFRQWKRSEQESIIISKEDDMEVLIQKILKYAGEVLDTDTLDQLLGVDAVENIDSKRLKRSRMVNRVNDFYMGDKGKELIVRVKNPTDKRYVSYKIDA